MLGYSESRILKKVGGGCDGVKIGEQCWAPKNLAIDDGLGGIYPPDGDINNIEGFGLLYDYPAAVRVSALVDNFHLPSRSEFEILINNTGGYQYAGTNLACNHLAHWKPNLVGPGDYEFNAAGAGRKYPNDGQYNNFKSNFGFYCSTTDSSGTGYFLWRISLNVDFGTWDNSAAFSVRLIKDV